MKFVSLFTGAGGLDLGFKKAGFESSGFVEFWVPAIETILVNTDDKLIKEDITKVTQEDFKGISADVVIGGPPCQGFSMAGNRDVYDQRNTLFGDYLRVVDYTNPRFCVMENVKGIGTMRAPDGEFVLNKIFKEFELRGFKVKAKVLNASNYEVPQIRQRVIIVAYKGKKEYQYPEPVKEKKYVSEALNLPFEEIQEIQHIYDKSPKLMKKGHFLKEGANVSSFGSAGMKIRRSFSNTITKSGRYLHPVYNRLLSIREVARIQTFPDEWRFMGSRQDMYGQIGNAVPVNMAYHIAKSIKEYLESDENTTE